MRDITELLNSKYPVIQGGRGNIADHWRVEEIFRDRFKTNRFREEVPL